MWSFARPPCDQPSHTESAAPIPGAPSWGPAAVRAHDARSADRVAVAERDAGLGLVAQLARTASALYEMRAWSTFGFPHKADYCRERLSRSSRWLQDHAALGAAIANLPLLEAALVGRNGERRSVAWWQLQSAALRPSRMSHPGSNARAQHERAQVPRRTTRATRTGRTGRRSRVEHARRAAGISAHSRGA